MKIGITRHPCYFLLPALQWNCGYDIFGYPFPWELIVWCGNYGISIKGTI